MANTWISFVKAYAAKNKISYTAALKKAGPEYRKQKGGKSAAPVKKGKKVKEEKVKKGKKVKEVVEEKK